jgi:hypothetical protein
MYLSVGISHKFNLKCHLTILKSIKRLLISNHSPFTAMASINPEEVAELTRLCLLDMSPIFDEPQSENGTPGHNYDELAICCISDGSFTQSAEKPHQPTQHESDPIFPVQQSEVDAMIISCIQDGSFIEDKQGNACDLSTTSLGGPNFVTFFLYNPNTTAVIWMYLYLRSRAAVA